MGQESQTAPVDVAKELLRLTNMSLAEFTSAVLELELRPWQISILDSFEHKFLEAKEEDPGKAKGKALQIVPLVPYAGNEFDW